MPAGLQAWNEQGQLVVDLGDFTTRFFTSFQVTIPAQQTNAIVGAAGVTPTGHFAVITEGNDSLTAGLLMTELYASCGNGLVNVISLTGAYTIARTVRVDIYAVL